MDPNVVLQQMVAVVGALFAMILLWAFMGAFAYMALQWFKHRKREQYALSFVTLMIKVPKDNETKIDAAEQMFSSFYSLKNRGVAGFMKPDDIISFEIVALKEEIVFYVSCSRATRDYVEKQIHGAYPNAHINEVDEVNIFSKKGKVAFAALTLEQSDFKPLKPYKDLPTDGLSLITSALAKMGPGEGAVVQLLIQPLSRKWQDNGRSYVQKQKKREADPDKASYNHDPKEMEAITTKCEKVGFRVALRIVVSSPEEHTAESHINNITGAFSQFSSAYNNIKKGRVFMKHLFMIDFIYRYMPLFNRNAMILNTEELATIFHLPNKMIETHFIKWLNAKHAPAPNNIPSKGLFLGKSEYRGETRNVFIGDDDRRRHMYIIGKTGTGKSEFLKEMILQDIDNGNGVCAVDPHGEFIEDILQLMPPERADDV
ncbi:MAG: DUF87 domain-containing protein, partial [Candidatus Pacebacteria bacterium]|nr:DUF87 domain-containing protein [Candidatus Paceibacterota bacterium]